MKKYNSAISILACLNLFAVSVTAVGVELIKPDESFYTSEDTIKVRLGTLPRSVWPYLHMELDDIDLSQLTSRFNDVLQYKPVEPLTTGPHQLRLIAVTPDGNIEEIAVWKLDVRTSAGFIESKIEANMDLQVTQRVADNFTSDTVGRTQGQGGAAFSSLHSTDNVRITSSADFIYNSQIEQTPNNRKLEVNQFNLTSEWSQAGVSIGQQNIPTNSLILTDFNRRGVTASVNTESGNLIATVFGTRTETISGFEHGLGVSDGNHRTQGAVIRIAPLANAPESLIVSAMHLNGRGMVSGLAEVADETEYTSGSASDIMLESYRMNKKLYLRGEYAISSTDFDGTGSGYGSVDDRASTMYVQYATERDSSRTGDGNWAIGLLRKRVGPWFHSLGNTYLPTDKVLTQLNTSYQSSAWMINTNTAVEKSNEANEQTIPTVETRIFSAQLAYSPQSDVSASTSGILSHPNYSLGVTKGSERQISMPSGFDGDGTDRNTTEVFLAAEFTGDSWSWRIARAISKEVDEINSVNDTENTITSLNVSFPLTTRFMFGSEFQVTRNTYINSGSTTNGRNIGITLNYDNQENWSGGVNYTATQEDGGVEYSNTRTYGVGVVVMWAYQIANINKPGLRLFATANHQESISADLKSSQYQVFVGLNLTFPLAY